MAPKFVYFKRIIIHAETTIKPETEKNGVPHNSMRNQRNEWCLFSSLSC